MQNPKRLLFILGIKSDLTWQLILPVWRERGESGRDSVGDGVPTPRLFLLLLRQLKHKNIKSSDCNRQFSSVTYPLVSSTEITPIYIFLMQRIFWL